MKTYYNLILVPDYACVKLQSTYVIDIAVFQQLLFPKNTIYCNSIPIKQILDRIYEMAILINFVDIASFFNEMYKKDEYNLLTVLEKMDNFLKKDITGHCFEISRFVTGKLPTVDKLILKGTLFKPFNHVQLIR